MRHFDTCRDICQSEEDKMLLLYRILIFSCEIILVKTISIDFDQLYGILKNLVKYIEPICFIC